MITLERRKRKEGVYPPMSQAYRGYLNKTTQGPGGVFLIIDRQGQLKLAPKQI